MNLDIIYSDKYQINLAGLEYLHPFDFNKYTKIFQKLIEDDLVSPKNIFAPEPITDAQIALVHTPLFSHNLKNPAKIAAYLEAPFLAEADPGFIEKGLLYPLRVITGGTLLAARRALRSGLAVNLGGGYHHSLPDAGEGFCIYNDIPIAIRVLLAEKTINKAMIIDLDVHQGNGCAFIFCLNPNVFTFSMHQGDIYPYPKPASDLDIELDSGTDDQTYLEILHRALPDLFQRFTPDLVFYIAGCDTMSGDPLANLKMSAVGIIKRDAAVIQACRSRQIPVAMTLGGGYLPNAYHIQYLSIRHLIKLPQ